MAELSNDKLHIVIADKGAELQSIIRKDLDMEYLWSGDPAFWAKKSPVLFPVVGGLKGNKYEYEGHSYTLGRHGFAREQLFEIVEHSPEHLTFRLTDNEETRKVYPFRFIFDIRYFISGEQLKVTYEIKNTGKDALFFSVGAHPAFRVPLAPGTSYEDYYLHFNKPENADRWTLSPEGQIGDAPVPYFDETQQLPLNKSLFYKDALVFKHLQSAAVSILSEATPHGLEMSIEGFPYLGIWAAKDADFVCIEPWCGIADHVSATGKLEEKEGIIRLPAGDSFERHWTATFF